MTKLWRFPYGPGIIGKMWQDIKNIYHLFQAVFANTLYGFPGRSMTVIGVTGTDGKTTTASLIYHILQSSGEKTALLTTVSAQIAGKSYDTGFHVTTPDPFSIQKYLQMAKRAKVKYFVLEITSHALDQHRVWGVPFAIGVLTNVTHEHLDYHKTYERYVEAKCKLLRAARVAIVNKDDRSYKLVAKSIKQRAKDTVITYGLQDGDVNEKKFPFETKLLGEFNHYNCLAAIATCQQIGLSDEKIRKGIKTFAPPVGREEIVYDKEFTVMVDFAHTPNAIAQILSAVKEQMVGEGRLIHVFGSAGERDKTKRPEMGENSAKYADVIVLTAEDPRSESVEEICEEIAGGIKNQEFRILDLEDTKNGKKYLVTIPDRREAIQFAISQAEKNDFVTITGKGHEQSMNMGNGEIPWSDVEEVKKALEKKKKK